MSENPDLVRPIAEDVADALALAEAEAPYLCRLVRAMPELASDIAMKGPGSVLEGVLSRLDDAALTTLSEDALMNALRDAKRAAHLALAIGDLTGVFDLDAVVFGLSDLADAAVRIGLEAAARMEGTTTRGLFAIALGKHGARELNYSSDIDIAVFFDADQFDGADRTPQQTASRIAKRLVHLLETQTGDGYVFRTDLRLRPDPRSTQPAVSTRMAELYYESVGQNWERMVYLKARAIAGDLDTAHAYLETMQPFVWRRNLDYWAIADIHAIKRQINRAGNHRGLADPDPDLKLGPGGIREIEFFVQTQQLIMGGRVPALRTPRTEAALQALTEAGLVDPDQAAVLIGAYRAFRGLEHRVQMRTDAQTHRLPADTAARMSVARLAGWQDLDAFDAAVAARRQKVSALYLDLFADEERRADAAGNLVFTGVDPDPGTVETLSGIGFSQPERVIAAIADWHRGKTPATCTERGRELLTALIPSLLREMGETGEPDLAFTRFETFFSGLRTGVQTLSMLLAEPQLLDDLVTTLALAPALSKGLAQRPDLLEALFFEAGDGFGIEIDTENGFEHALDAARRAHREADFRLGFNVLHGALPAQEAGPAYTALAQACLSAMTDAARRETARRHGPAPCDVAVCAMGKFGGRELSSGSDLDMLVIYAPRSGEGGAQAWATRFVQTLTTAISAPTGEGLLYEVDMDLRPSGRAGPVAVSLSAFERYQKRDAWTWEHMALCRFRPVAGDGALCARAQAIAREVLSTPRDANALRRDVLDMRQRLARDRAGQGLWDLKLDPGGLVDIEFIVQHALLGLGPRFPDVHHHATRDALQALCRAGVFEADEGALLVGTLDRLLNLQQVLRIAVSGLFRPETASDALKRRIARAGHAADFAALEQALKSDKARVADIRLQKIGALATETAR